MQSTLTVTTKGLEELDQRPILAILKSRNYGTIIARDLESVKLIKETLVFIKKDMLFAQTLGDKR